MAAFGRRLSEAEIEAYDHIPADLARRVKILNIPFIPGGFHGITLGTWILVAVPVPSDGSSELMAHELVHVRQWQDLGRIRFTGHYLGSFLSTLRLHRRWKVAYWLIDAECEARDEAGRWRDERNRSVSDSDS